jgi:CDP-diacylglycerol pyrophosphatase
MRFMSWKKANRGWNACSFRAFVAGAVGAAALLTILPVHAPAAPNPRLRLWERAEACVEQAKHRAIKYPCVKVSKSENYAIVHDTEVGKQGVYMLLAAIRVTGIEDPLVLVPPVRAFFSFGWDALMSEIKRHPSELAMAINNKASRTQDQFHIHLGCVTADVRAAIDKLQLSSSWQANALKVKGRTFDVIEVDSLAQSPFLLLKAYLDSLTPKQQIGDYSMAVIGQASGKFVVLATTSAAELVMEEGIACHKPTRH